MPNLTTDTLVRAKFQLTDTTLVPSSLVQTSIDDAHTELVRFLDPVMVTTPPEDALIMGETLLAGAHLYRALAAKESFDQKHIGIGRQHLEEGKRFEALTAVADRADAMAWYLLEPYVRAKPARIAAQATDTAPVLGGG